MADTDFWQAGGGGDDNPVVRHAPDLHGYHPPESDLTRNAGNGRAGRRVATIPAARRDGTSYGFDANVAAPVHVDPQAPDGGVVFDPSEVSPGLLDTAVATSTYPHEVYYKLGHAPSRKSRAAADVGTEEPQVKQTRTTQQSVIPAAPVMPVLQPMALPTQPFQQPDPNLAAMLGQQQAMFNSMSSAMNAMSLRLAQLEQPLALPGPVGKKRQQPLQPEEFADAEEQAARPIRQRVKREKGDIVATEEEPSDIPTSRSLLAQNKKKSRQTVEEFERDDEPVDGVILGFETLHLPFVQGPIGLKAKCKVYFDIPNAGRHSANYHAVIDSETCVVLAYDTRYEDGQQYLPPDMRDSPMRLHVPGTKKDYSVCSMGLAYSFGVFDMIVLIKVNDDIVPEE